MKCHQCQQTIPDTVRFCAYCSARATAPAAPAAPVEPEPSAPVAPRSPPGPTNGAGGPERAAAQGPLAGITPSSPSRYPAPVATPGASSYQGGSVRGQLAGRAAPAIPSYAVPEIAPSLGRISPGLMRRRSAETPGLASAPADGAQAEKPGPAPAVATVNPGALQRRNKWRQVLWCVLSGGVYGLYWYYATYKEMLEYRGLKESPGWWFTLLLVGHLVFFIPVPLLYAWWKYARLFQEFTGEDRQTALMTFGLLCLMPPLAWARVQSEINRRAARGPVKPLIFDRSFGYAFMCPTVGAVGGALVGLAVWLIIGGELGDTGQARLWAYLSGVEDAAIQAAVWSVSSLFDGALVGGLVGTFLGTRAVHQSGTSRAWRGLAVGLLISAAVGAGGAVTLLGYLGQVSRPFGA